MHVLSQNFTIAGCAHGQQVQVHLSLGQLRTGQKKIGSGGTKSRLGCLQVEVFALLHILADHSLGEKAVGAGEIVFLVLDLDLGFLDLSLQQRNLGLLRGDFRLGIPGILTEQGITLLHPIPHLHVDVHNQSGQNRGYNDILIDRLHDTTGTDRIGVGCV